MARQTTRNGRPRQAQRQPPRWRKTATANRTSPPDQATQDRSGPPATQDHVLLAHIGTVSFATWIAGATCRARTCCWPIRAWQRPNDRLGRALVKAAVGRAQQRARDGQIAPEEVADAAVAELPARATALTPVINATGVLVHTNLGRAPLSAAAVDAIVAAAGPCDVEFDLASGARAGAARARWPPWPRAVPAAEAVAVVNNNAAALVLAATALSRPGRRDRDQPGRADRDRRPLPAARPARLDRRPAARGRHHQPDDARGLRGGGRPATPAFILKVHPSNFRIEGFTAAAAVAELAGLGVPGGVRHRLRAARRRTRCCPTSRTPPPRCGTAPPWSPRAATSSSAARRPACCSAGPAWCAR